MVADRGTNWALGMRLTPNNWIETLSPLSTLHSSPSAQRRAKACSDIPQVCKDLCITSDWLVLYYFQMCFAIGQNQNQNRSRKTR